MKKFKITLAWQIIIALILGILLGSIIHNQGELRDWIIMNILSPTGNIFIRMIKMIMVPIVVTTLIIGIAGLGNTKNISNIGFKTILYFEIITTLAIIIGITLANIFHPGTGINMSKLAVVDITQYKQITLENNYSIVKHILSIIPENIFAAVAKGDMLPIIFFSILFGIGLATLQENTRKPLINVLNSIAETMFKVTNIVMSYAPIGVFSLISITIATFGFYSLLPLAKLILLVYGAIIFFALVILGSIARICHIRILTLIYILKDELIIAFFTASSESVFPRIIEKMESYGASSAITNFVVPTGYSFNLDGSTLYQSIAAIFIAQLYNIELTISQEIILVFTLMITSKGMAGVPGVSFIVLLSTLGSTGIPLEGLAFIAGIDRIIDMARTALNVIGNALAVLVIAKWENQYNAMQALEYEQKCYKRKNK